VRLLIGTRGSALARAQASDVARRLEVLGHTTETVVISTVGDRAADRAFAEVGSFGVFVREIENALLEGRVDVAVHSYKDLPSRGPDGLVVAAVPERVDAADVLLARPEVADAADGEIPLRHGGSVGTAAARRQALLHAARPDLSIGLLRGNVPTRLRALAEGRFGAIVLAAAGLERLERTTAAGGTPLMPAEIVGTRLDPRSFVPAPAQGAIAVQVRVDAHAVREAVSALDDPRPARALRAERRLLGLVEAGCDRPFGAWCDEASGGALTLFAVLGQGAGGITRAAATGDDPEALAASVWHQLASGVRA